MLPLTLHGNDFPGTVSLTAGSATAGSDDFGRSTPTLVLLHGYPLDSSLWSDCIPLLTERLRVITFDLRGFGKSSLGDTASYPYTMESSADDVAHSLTKLGITGPVILGGLSMGGYVAFEFVRKYPDRLNGLILMDTRAIADSPEAAQKRLEAASLAENEGTRKAVEPMIEKLLAPRQFTNNKQLVERLSGMMFRVPKETVAAVQRAMAKRRDMSTLLGQIQVPTLVCVGTSDSIASPKEMKEFAAKIPTSQFVEVSDSGHLPPMENPQELAAVIQRFCREIT